MLITNIEIHFRLQVVYAMDGKVNEIILRCLLLAINLVVDIHYVSICYHYLFLIYIYLLKLVPLNLLLLLLLLKLETDH